MFFSRIRQKLLKFRVADHPPSIPIFGVYLCMTTGKQAQHMHSLGKLGTLLVICCVTPLATAQQQNLKAEISWTGVTVKHADSFSLNAVLRNTGSTERSLTIWTCPVSAQWVPDSPVVRVNQDTPCQQPAASLIRIKSGEKYTEAIPISFHLPANQAIPNSVTFRLGFSELTRLSDVGHKEPSIWSNGVTIPVTR